jgi:hypothetical protein
MTYLDLHFFIYLKIMEKGTMRIQTDITAFLLLGAIRSLVGDGHPLTWKHFLNLVAVEQNG